MTTLNIEGKVREVTGKKASAALRNEGRVPCVIYGGDETISFSVDAIDLNPLVYTPAFKMVVLNIGGKEYKAILKDLDFHPVTDKIWHLDFQELIPGKKVTTEIPVTIEGDAPGVLDGGRLVVTLRKLRVKALAEKLVDNIIVDVSDLAMGKTIKVGEIDIPEGIEILNATSISIVQVITPRTMRSAAAEEEEEDDDELEGEDTEEETEEASEE